MKLAVALTVAACVCGTGWIPGAVFGVQSAGAAPPDPAANLQLGALPLACYGQPASAACETPIVGYLDAARESFGFGPYELPADFVGLAPERQLFILANLDRRTYSLPLISGLSPQLDAAAAAGASVEQDPAAPSVDRAVWASAWAAGLLNVLDAYYQWMYSDGYPGLNIDCPDRAAVGCWVHRHGILFGFGRSVTLTMGAGATSDRTGQPVVGLLIAATGRATAPAENYTWADAEADGAGQPSGAARKAPGPAQPRITGSKVGASGGTARIYFTTGLRGGHFQCSLAPVARAGPRPSRYSACRSPAGYRGLRPGGYDFSVRSVAPAGRPSAAARRHIAIG